MKTCVIVDVSPSHVTSILHTGGVESQVDAGLAPEIAAKDAPQTPAIHTGRPSESDETPRNPWDARPFLYVASWRDVDSSCRSPSDSLVASQETYRDQRTYDVYQW